MKGYNVVAEMMFNGAPTRKTRIISEVELENLKKSEVFTIVSIEDAGEYKEPGMLLSQHPGFKKLLTRIEA